MLYFIKLSEVYVKMNNIVHLTFLLHYQILPKQLFPALQISESKTYHFQQILPVQVA